MHLLVQHGDVLILLTVQLSMHLLVQRIFSTSGTIIENPVSQQKICTSVALVPEVQTPFLLEKSVYLKVVLTSATSKQKLSQQFM